MEHYKKCSLFENIKQYLFYCHDFLPEYISNTCTHIFKSLHALCAQCVFSAASTIQLNLNVKETVDVTHAPETSTQNANVYHLFPLHSEQKRMSYAVYLHQYLDVLVYAILPAGRVILTVSFNTARTMRDETNK